MNANQGIILVFFFMALAGEIGRCLKHNLPAKQDPRTHDKFWSGLQPSVTNIFFSI